MKKWFSVFLVVLILVVLMVIGFNYLVSSHTRAFVTNDIHAIDETKVAVLLGTSRYLSNGSKNSYFEYRMDAAARLYKAGKVKYILVSGDNRKKNYNEPVAMQKALMERGVPEEHIILDYAGFRTLDSIVRAREVFGQKEFIVVSQQFHNERAVYIARHKGMDAYGYNARDVEVAAGFRTRLREMLARTKMMLDLYILHTEPHFLGEEIKIED